MFCPKCGSNQGEGKKFCTVCGTNLMVVSQALTGQLSAPPVNYIPQGIAPLELERQQEMKKGITIFQHIGILSLEFHVDKLSRPLL